MDIRETIDNKFLVKYNNIKIKIVQVNKDIMDEEAHLLGSIITNLTS